MLFYPPHKHSPMVFRMSPEGYRWACIYCPTVGGPPYATSAEAWRAGNGVNAPRRTPAVGLAYIG